MKCEVALCVYNKDFNCIIDSIEINSMGMCEACIIISLEKEFLAAEKGRQLNEIEQRWTENKQEQRFT